jgi:hypothetical protein
MKLFVNSRELDLECTNASLDGEIWASPAWSKNRLSKSSSIFEEIQPVDLEGSDEMYCNSIEQDSNELSSQFSIDSLAAASLRLWTS